HRSILHCRHRSLTLDYSQQITRKDGVTRIERLTARNSKRTGHVLAVMAALGAAGYFALQSPTSLSHGRIASPATHHVSLPSVGRMVAVFATLACGSIALAAVAKSRPLTAFALQLQTARTPGKIERRVRRRAFVMSFHSGGRYGP